MNSHLAEKVNKMAVLDQKLLKSLNQHRKTSCEQRISLDKLNIEHESEMKKIVREFGLPTIALVGEKASSNAWMLVQHSRDLDFMKGYLNLLKQNINNIKKSNIAYLEDKIMFREMGKQLYGTQLQRLKGKKRYTPCTIIDSKNVDKRRAVLDMEPLKEYLEFCKTI